MRGENGQAVPRGLEQGWDRGWGPPGVLGLHGWGWGLGDCLHDWTPVSWKRKRAHEDPSPHF